MKYCYCAIQTGVLTSVYEAAAMYTCWYSVLYTCWYKVLYICWYSLLYTCWYIVLYTSSPWNHDILDQPLLKWLQFNLIDDKLYNLVHIYASLAGQSRLKYKVPINLTNQSACQTEVGCHLNREIPSFDINVQCIMRVAV